MKKLIFAFPLLALAAVFTFCHKSEVVNGLTGDSTQVPVQDRACGDKCIISFIMNNINTLDVCGVADNTTQCALCTTAGWSGFQQISPGSVPFQVLACGGFSITNNSNYGTSISFDNGASYTLIPAYGCVRFKVLSDCTVVPS